MIIREIKPQEYSFLEETLFEAIFVPEGEIKLQKEIIYQSGIFKYIKDFGKFSDLCLVAEVDAELVGAVWTRLFSESNKGYGFVDDNTPELSIAVLPNFRNKGIGGSLMNKMFVELRIRNIARVSLSVDIRNRAYKKYIELDFKEVERSVSTVTMVKTL